MSAGNFSGGGTDVPRQWSSIGGECADGCRRNAHTAAVLHPQTPLAFNRKRGPLKPEFSRPPEVSVPAKLRFKKPRFVTTLPGINRQLSGFWRDRDCNRSSST